MTSNDPDVLTVENIQATTRSSQMAVILAIQQEITELREENVRIKRKLENTEGQGDQQHPSKTHVTSLPTHMETTGENAQNTHTPKEGTINIVAPRRGAHKHPFVDGIIETPLP